MNCTVRQFLSHLASPRWLAWLLPWFMLLLLLGTLAQRYIGLAEAERLFFASWILWLGPLPLPGGILTLGALTLSLLARLLLYSPWSRASTGIILAHLGVLLLLLGGALTALFNQEGYIALLEGKSAKQMEDYYAREFVIEKEGKVLARWPEEALQEGTTLTAPTLPFKLKINEFCSNCASYKQEDPTGKKGLARKLFLDDAQPAKEKEENKAGIMFTLSGAGKADGLYLAYELLASRPAQWEGGYRAVIRRQTHPLPFAIHLLEFEKLRYPGSNQAKEYRSLVEISDEFGKQQATIAMNEPLRYRGYAIYQSSFLQMGTEQASVLSVVKNDAWLAPYFATFVLALGLILHGWQRSKRI